MKVMRMKNIIMKQVKRNNETSSNEKRNNGARKT